MTKFDCAAVCALMDQYQLEMVEADVPRPQPAPVGVGGGSREWNFLRWVDLNRLIHTAFCNVEMPSWGVRGSWQPFRVASQDCLPCDSMVFMPQKLLAKHHCCESMTPAGVYACNATQCVLFYSMLILFESLVLCVRIANMYMVCTVRMQCGVCLWCVYIYIYGMYMVSKKFPGMWWYVMACNGMMCNVMEGNVMHVCVLCNGCNGYCGHWWNARNGCTGYNACTECTECNVCNVHCNV